MRLKSRGLGRKELVLDFREYEVVRQDNEVVVVGTIRDPVNWDFSIRVCEDDLSGLLHLAGKKAILGLALRSLFKRSKENHWTQELSEHLAEGALHLEAAKQMAIARLEAPAPLSAEMERSIRDSSS